MRIILGYALTIAVSAVMASAVMRVLHPQAQEAQDALQFLVDHWPR